MARNRTKGAMSVRTRGMDELQRAITRYPERLGELFSERLVSGARVLGTELARNSLPFGGRKGDEEAFQQTITNAIFHLFSPGRTWEDIQKRKGKKAAAKFWWLVEQENWPAVRKYLKQLGGDFAGIQVRRTVPREVHDEARNYLLRGHIPKRTVQTVMVTNVDAIRRFAKRQGRTVGAAKASWMAAAKAASPSGRVSKGMPAWANTGRHKKATGSVTYTGTGRKRVARLRSDCPWAKVALPKYHENRALGSARGRLRKAMIHAIRAEERKWKRALGSG